MWLECMADLAMEARAETWGWGDEKPDKGW